MFRAQQTFAGKWAKNSMGPIDILYLPELGLNFSLPYPLFGRLPNSSAHNMKRARAMLHCPALLNQLQIGVLTPVKDWCGFC
jgi:hypothetical protein